MAKLKKAAKQTGIKQIAIGGGVSANSGLQKAVYDEGTRAGWDVFIPRLGFSLDNAGMVAVTGYYKYLASRFIGLDAPAGYRLHLPSASYRLLFLRCRLYSSSSSVYRGNRRVSEGNREACFLIAERELVRDRLPGSLGRKADGGV